MTSRTDNLTVGDRAPDFELPTAANDMHFSLSCLLTRGPLIVEFLRGTW